MKNFKKLLGVALIAVLAVTAMACTPDNGKDGNNTPTNSAARTPEVRTVKLTTDQMNNYIIKYDVTKSSVELVLDETTGEYVQAESTTKNMIEVGYSAMVLRSANNGETYGLDGAGVACFAVTNVNDERSFLTAHFNYQEDQLELKGTETVAGYECKHYYFKNGLIEVNMYVNEEMDMCLKYDNAFTNIAAEVTDISFGKVDTEGYEWASYIALIPTPEPPTAE